MELHALSSRAADHKTTCRQRSLLLHDLIWVCYISTLSSTPALHFLTHLIEATATMPPQIILGTACFGMDKTSFQTSDDVSTLLAAIQRAGVSRLDCGARYPPLKPGRAEELIGETKALSDAFEVDTKVYTDTRTDGSGDLTANAIARSVEGSLKRLGRPDGVRSRVVPFEMEVSVADSLRCMWCRSRSCISIARTRARRSWSRSGRSMSRSGWGIVNKFVFNLIHSSHPDSRLT